MEQIWLVADRLGLNLFALIAAGLGLHAWLGLLGTPINRFWRPLIALLCALMLICTLGRLLLLNAEIAGNLGDAFSPDTLPFAWAALATPTILLLVGVFAILAGTILHNRLLMGLSAVVIATSFASTGHTHGLATPGAAPIAVGLHFLTASYWIAAPLSLHPALNADNDGLHAKLERFSRWAILAVPALLVLGVWLSWQLAGGFSGLLVSVYGWLLLAKLALALLAMMAGAVNKQFVTSLITSQPKRGRKWLMATLTIEASLFLTAVTLISLATTVFPPTHAEGV